MNDKTILIVDDTIENLDLLIKLLDKYDVINTISGSEALEIVNEEKIDLILLDIVMPNMNGYEVCKKLKENNKTKDIPIIFITSKEDEDSIEQAYEVGGVDYITKPFKPRELLARVKLHLKMQALIDSYELSQKELKHLACIDPMTKLYNRRHFTDASESIYKLAKRDQTELSLVLLDIDNFKNINDTYGHDIGDKVIINLAEMLRDSTRQSDIVCRYGGEEFLILLPETNKEGAYKIAEKIRNKIESFCISINETLCINYTVSIGVSLVDYNNNFNIEQSIKKADISLYNAKSSGKNKVCVSL